MNTNNLTPKLRFPEFKDCGEWEEKKLEEIIGIVIAPKKLSQSMFNKTGKYPIIDQSQNKICGWTDDDNSIINEKFPLIIFGDHTCILKIVNRPFAQGSDGIKILKVKKNENINPKFLFQYLQFNHIPQIGYQRHFSILKEIEVYFPNEKGQIEQQKIADCLTSIDEVIAAHTRKLELLKAQKKGLMQKLFPAKGKSLPELRFPEFKDCGEWETKKMEEFFLIRNGYTPSKTNKDYWTDGTIPWFRMEDIRENGGILSDSIQHITEKAIKGGRLFPAYSIIVATTATIGVHALLIVDSLANQQFTFLTKRKSFDKKINMIYFYYYMFLVDEWCKKNCNTGGLAAVDMIGFKKQLIPMPLFSEQQKIADCLTSLDDLITATGEKLEALQIHKKGLMQQLFPKM
ncbi:MAG: restriction endonuclease subunit S [Bacteroidales bacterium]|nr:restriction endonuclease subunit S [Bacteroidales bacterium]